MAASLPLSSAERLKNLENRILQSWEEKIRAEMPLSKEVPHPVLINTMPLFVKQLAEALDPAHPRKTATEGSNVAEEHGGERARVTPFGPEQILKEYAVLREVVAAELANSGGYMEPDRRIVEQSIDVATREAMTAFFLVHNRLREQFVAALSHDLRNPLGVVRMATELLLNSFDQIPTPELLAENKDLLERILKSADKIDRMTRDLLDQSAMQFGEQFTVRRTSMDLKDLVLTVVTEVIENTAAKINFVGSPVRGDWDPKLLYRAVENVVMNSVKYGAPGKLITVTVKTEHSRALVSVHNDGDPIPVEEQGLLFQSFRRSTSAKAGNKRGWGVGLGFVRSVVEAHSGSIGVDSGPERGTTFTIDIPMSL